MPDGDTATSVFGARWRFSDCTPVDFDDEVAIEMPINIRFGSVPYAVMMATPADLEDFVTGFSLTEGLIEHANEIHDISVEPGAEAVSVDIRLSPGRFRTHLRRKRQLSGRTSCGVCGIEDAQDLPQTTRRISPNAPPINTGAVAKSFAGLRALQPLHARTRAVHGAFWCDRNGEISIVREDVGRHNALDKLIGALVRARISPDAGFIMVTSRASYEMVEKAAAFGVATLVTISAPTSLAISRARETGLTLVSSVRDEECKTYSGALAG
ncbi:MAG: formate dehydrogenase family accessory protein FdhD [Hyphomicrobiales bacterium]|nr:formate dehydrogenase family accessory protein FdhD [Hyphomicrobiales bacterium]